MFGRKRPRVLIAGAGPAGLLGALCLSERGFPVQVIDSSPADEAVRRRGTRGSVTLLYPRSLELLDRHGIAAPLLREAQKVRTIGVYAQGERMGELSFELLSGARGSRFGFAAIVLAADIERFAVAALRKRRAEVFFERRLVRIEQGSARVRATLEHLGSDSAGYATAHGELIVEKSEELEVEFLLAADGHDSVARQQLDVTLRELAPPERYEVFDGPARGCLPDEGELLLADAASAVVWPLPGDRWRWLVGPEPGAMARLAAGLPWLGSVVDELEARGHVQAEYLLASAFGRGRIWLAGGAAHATSPLGAQSTNVGMAEGVRLGDLLADILEGSQPLDALADYERERADEWRRLLPPGVGHAPAATRTTHGRLALGRLTPCLPACAAELDALLEPMRGRLAPAS
jgi:2-polyprenyl-6-methoxyphenol hydroxylase-like FAD-dependent oxidoreductase